MTMPPAAMAETKARGHQMADQQEVHSLTESLDVLDRAGEGKDEASVADIHEAIGVLLAAGLIGLTPIGDIPVVPTILAESSS